MGSYGKFQNDNKKYGTRNRNDYNPDFNPTVKTKGNKVQSKFEKNFPKYKYLIAWARWYPDLFLDLISPKEGKLSLNLDQRVFLRTISRFMSVYAVFPRGYSKTMLEVFGLEITAVLYPGIELALTAQTKENAGEFLETKHREMVKFYPLWSGEIADTKFAKGDANIEYVHNSIIDILPNDKNAKGQRRRRISMEEAALINGEVFKDALAPVVDIARTTIGKYAVVDPQELNHQINFFTTAGFKGTDEYVRCVSMHDNMCELSGNLVLGSDWHLACWYGRGRSKSAILRIKADSSPITFGQNYESKWVGNDNNALVNINDLMDSRKLLEPELEPDPNGEYYLGVDVGRSVKKKGNVTAIVVLRVFRNSKGRLKKLQAVNMFEVPGTSTFTNQAIAVKRVKSKYNARVVCVDTNGLGVGLHDELLKVNIDDSEEEYGAWNTINTEATPETSDYETCLFDLKPQTANTQVITTFVDLVRSGKLELLVRKAKSEYTLQDMEQKTDAVLPYLLTDELFEEICNLKLVTKPNNRIAVEQISRKYDKDKYSALVYVLWYVKIYEEVSVVKEDDLEGLMSCMIM
jgi:hypothetical protein